MKELERILRNTSVGDTVEVIYDGDIYHFTRCGKRFPTFTVMINGYIYERKPIFQPKIITSWLKEGTFKE